ncbi:MAG: aldose 1-epimerase [Devosia sp.]|nr:aldose 1-epimerase [Devosia sp.]
MAAIVVEAGELALTLLPELGGSVGAFQLATADGPFDLMRPLTVPAGAQPAALYAGMFPMLPFANCIRDNSFVFEGKRYAVRPNMAGARLNYHGSGWQLPWTVSRSGAGFAELVLEDAVVDEAYRFSASQRFHLDPTGLSVETSVTNRADRAMPFSFGQHPWFPTHGRVLTKFDATGWWREDAAGHAERLEALDDLSDYRTWRTPPASYRNACYAGWTGRAELVWPDAGIGMVIDADPVFGHLMFHVPRGNLEVFCLEPQTNAPCAFDGLDVGRVASGVHILAPGERLAGSLRFSVSGQFSSTAAGI